MFLRFCSTTTERKLPSLDISLQITLLHFTSILPLLSVPKITYQYCPPIAKANRGGHWLYSLTPLSHSRADKENLINAFRFSEREAKSVLFSRNTSTCVMECQYNYSHHFLSVSSCHLSGRCIFFICKLKVVTFRLVNSVLLSLAKVLKNNICNIYVLKCMLFSNMNMP